MLRPHQEHLRLRQAPPGQQVLVALVLRPHQEHLQLRQAPPGQRVLVALALLAGQLCLALGFPVAPLTLVGRQDLQGLVVLEARSSA